MLHSLKYLRLALAFGLDVLGDVVLGAEEGLAKAAAIPTRLVFAVGRPLERVRRVIDRGAAILDPGEGYVPLVTPLLNAIDPLDGYWQDEDYAMAFDIIERTRVIRDRGPQ